MPDLIALRAMFGQDEGNHGTARYRVAVDHLIHVPKGVASYLVNKGGFAAEPETVAGETHRKTTDSASPLLARLHHACSATCNYRGCTYKADERGEVLVPANAVAELISHGFVAVQSVQEVKGSSLVELDPVNNSELRNLPPEAVVALKKSRGDRSNDIR